MGDEFTIWTIPNLIGSSCPIIILCFLIYVVTKAKKITTRILAGCIILIVLMYLILLRT